MVVTPTGGHGASLGDPRKPVLYPDDPDPGKHLPGC